MTLESFIEVYKDLPIMGKIDKLIETMDIKGSDRVSWLNATRNRNEEEAEYWNREIKAMDARIEWLYAEISKGLDAG